MARALTLYLSQTNIIELRERTENKGGFQIAIAPMQPATFLNVKIATDKLYQQLVDSFVKSKKRMRLNFYKTYRHSLNNPDRNANGCFLSGAQG